MQKNNNNNNDQRTVPRYYLMDAVETLFPIQPSLDSIDSLSKNSGIFCVFETFVLFSDTYFIPVKISFTFFS